MKPTDESWSDWRATIWHTMAANLGGYPGLAPLEQYMLRSKKEKRCVECGETGAVKQISDLIKSVSHYWFCRDCDEYWRNKER